MSSSKQASVAVAFVGVPPSGSPPFPGFRSVFLNISSVRINHNPSAGLSSPGWVTIPVPSNASNGQGSTGGDLQIDLTQIQAQPEVFNLAPVPINTYSLAQVVVDPSNPGSVVPACQGAGAGTEGCIAYPIIVDNASQGIVLPLNNFKTSKGATVPLLLQMAAQTSGAGLENGVYHVTLTPSLANFSSFMGTISGTVTGSGGSHGLHQLVRSVTAELAGTATVVESAQVLGGAYTLELPASPEGTSYDLYVSGGGSTFAVIPAVVLKPGASLPKEDFVVKGVSIGNIAGTILDACTSNALPGATVNLLAPTSNTVDCSANPSQCVVVGTTATDQGGFYPLPGNITQPSIFNETPVGTNFGLQLKISAPGYNSQIQPVELTGSGMDCPNSFDKTRCSFSLLTSTLSGTVSLSQAPVAGTALQVQVFAENSGTNQLVSALTMPVQFQSGNTSAPFTINVPVGTGPFDLFAVAIDPYLGAPAPFSGHTIGTLAAAPGAAQCTDSTIGNIGPLDCAGHGSISGTLANPDLNSTVQVQDKNSGVLILGTAAGTLSSASGNNQYALCVPPGNYTVGRYEGPPNNNPSSPDFNPPVSSATVAVPTPQATSSPCPSTCFSDNAGTTCPGQCTATFANF